jgi:phage host-nuclease inhibitor protein Gam
MDINELRNRLAKLARKEDLIAIAKADMKAQVTAIQAAAAKIIGPLISERDLMEAEIKADIETHRATILGAGKTLSLDTHVIAYRSSETVTCEDEEATTASLMAMADDETASDADRMSAMACLRIAEPSLDKGFVKKNWKRFSAWFTGHGINKERSEKLSIKPLKTPEVETADA